MLLVEKKINGWDERTDGPTFMSLQEVMSTPSPYATLAY